MIVPGYSRSFAPYFTQLVPILRALSIALLAACALPQEQLAGTPPDLKIEVLIRGLDTPWAIDFAPDGRIFITERPGRIRVFGGGRLLPEPWMTLEVAAVSEAGLMGLALDPQFAQNRFVYVAYTYRAPNGRLQNRLVRLREEKRAVRVVRTKFLSIMSPAPTTMMADV
jgi:glucose/arabinose dehydrogenase